MRNGSQNGRPSKLRRAHALAVVLVLAGALTTLIIEDPGGRAARAGRERASVLASPTAAAAKAQPPATKAKDASGLVATREGRRTYASGAPALRFENIFPKQTVASVDPAVPATNYWALLIGINDYYGGTRDNIGSYQDARELRKHLLSLGWRGDHIVLLANRNATASMITQSLRWLASKTDGSSVVVFNYSGHEMPRHYGGTRHILLQAADNRYIADTILARDLGRVSAAKMWINLAVCRAGGFNDPGLVQPGRVVTFSSPERELSYEDPSVRHSVFGWFVIMQAMRYGYADANHNGDVTAEEAFNYAKRRTTARTSGMQHPFMIDKLSGSFSLIPPKPAPAAPPPDPGTSECIFVCPETSSRE